MHSPCRSSIDRLFISITVALLLTSAAAQNASAELHSLSDDELSGVYAEGFSNFTITDNPVTGFTETLAEFNIKASTYTTIDSLKMGYHDEYDYKDPTPTYGWDENWENVVLGQDYEDPSKDLKADGVFFKAVFDNIDDPETRELKSIMFGASSLTGDISADFISFSGTIDDSADGTPEYNGHGLNLGDKTITATDSYFAISFSIDGYDKGYWVTFDQATVQDRQYYPPP